MAIRPASNGAGTLAKVSAPAVVAAATGPGPLDVPTFKRAAYDLLRAYPLFDGVTMTTSPWARYRYDSLQVFAERKIKDFGQGGQFLVDQRSQITPLILLG